MDTPQDFSYVLTNWSFGLTILIGLIASEYSAAESLTSICIAAATTTLSAICSSTTSLNETTFRRRKFSDICYFLILWMEVLTNLVVAATCARLASAIVDYISKGHFREFLYGMEQHSLGEPWPDVLGVTIIIVVSILFMMGLEKSPVISSILLFALLSNFAFFTTIGSFHTVIHYKEWAGTFRLHSHRRVLRSAAECSFAFVSIFPSGTRNSFWKIIGMVFVPIIFYMALAIMFTLVTYHREMVGTAIPLVQIFEKRDVDWARPVVAAFTISVVCLLLTEVMPVVYNAFVKLSTKEWGIFVPLIQHRNSLSGAPVLAIFAAGSLAAILAFACPLSHLIKLLNTAAIIKSILISCQLVYNRYKAEIRHDWLVQSSNVQYSKLNRNSASANSTNTQQQSIKDRIKSFFTPKPQYIHQLSSPRNSHSAFVGTNENKEAEEKECLLLNDYINSSTNADLVDDDSGSDNDEGELVFCSEEESSTDTDIDVIVEEYREGLKVSTVGKFNEAKPSTKMTSAIVIMCLVTTLVASTTLSLYIMGITKFPWPSIIGIVLSLVIVTSMPQNSEDKSKDAIVPSILFPVCHFTSIILNIILSSTIILDIWEGIVFWNIAGLLLFWRCDCCTCDGLLRVAKLEHKMGSRQTSIYKQHLTDTVHISR